MKEERVHYGVKDLIHLIVVSTTNAVSKIEQEFENLHLRLQLLCVQ
jgi:hypothetical protein